MKELLSIFTLEEKIAKLISLGITVEPIKSWEYVSAYHNKADYVERDLLICYHESDRPSEQELSRDYYTVNEKYGVEREFERYLNAKFKWFVLSEKWDTTKQNNEKEQIRQERNKRFGRTSKFLYKEDLGEGDGLSGVSEEKTGIE